MGDLAQYWEKNAACMLNESNVVETNVKTLKKKLVKDLFLRFQPIEQLSWFNNPLSSWLLLLVSP